MSEFSDMPYLEDIAYLLSKKLTTDHNTNQTQRDAAAKPLARFLYPSYNLSRFQLHLLQISRPS